MTIYRPYIQMLSLLLSGSCHHNLVQSHQGPNLKGIPDRGKAIPIMMSLELDQSGGHIQGIQVYHSNKKPLVYFTGSSQEVAFLAVAEWGTVARVVRIDTLGVSPFRHAGGFQIMDHYLAVGIEDNHLRTNSKVVIMDLETADRRYAVRHTIERSGEYEVETAGAVGITKTGASVVVAVANWDARHLDWYLCPEEDFVRCTPCFQKIARMTMAQTNRSQWSDPDWASYQNINLFPGKKAGWIYLAGMATTPDGENVVDWYEVKLPEMENGFPTAHTSYSLEIIKKQRKVFGPIGNTSFRNGAGFSRHMDGTWNLWSGPHHLDNTSVIGIY